jgi:hypothetical protein
MFIDLARKEDLPRVVDLIMQRGDEFDYESNGFPLPKKHIVADTVYKNWMVSPCFVVKEDNEIVGLASTALFSFGWTDEPVLSTFMVYILPKHRSFDKIKQLYKAVQSYARLQGILYADDYIAIDRADARARLMRSLGFKQSGFLFTYNGKE